MTKKATYYEIIIDERYQCVSNFACKKHDRARYGFSLVELLATLAILVLVGMVVVTGIPAAHRAYVSAIDSSNAQVLLSTASTKLRDALSVANPTGSIDKERKKVPVKYVESGEETTKQYTQIISFESMETGYYTMILSDDDGVLYIGESNPMEEPASSEEDPVYCVSKPARLVAESAGQGADDAKGDLLVTLEGTIDWNESGIFIINNISVKREGNVIARASVDDITIRTIASK